MRRAQDIDATDSRDATIPGGCMLCGGDLVIRVTPGSAGTVCTACRWISRPHMRREDGGDIRVVHPGLIG
jgi:hypothetical protein